MIARERESLLYTPVASITVLRVAFWTFGRYTGYRVVTGVYAVITLVTLWMDNTLVTLVCGHLIGHWCHRTLHWSV